MLTRPPVGSSPLARGTRRPGRRNIAGPRFIPAGAGNAKNHCFARPAITVHPRWRGERCHAGYIRQWVSGSSPLARGTPYHAANLGRMPRFIPAGAGNAISLNAVYLGTTGSSPLARGTRQHGPQDHAQLRFIPAGAGNASVGSGCHSPLSVHPRWRGERSSQSAL